MVAHVHSLWKENHQILFPRIKSPLLKNRVNFSRNRKVPGVIMQLDVNTQMWKVKWILLVQLKRAE